ncbi:hypothetical protein KC357_g88 [Hortaea werneckii]|nr:hypothetical protein KC357_g88 [Hortaea werneckii]
MVQLDTYAEYRSKTRIRSVMLDTGIPAMRSHGHLIALSRCAPSQGSIYGIPQHRCESLIAWDCEYHENVAMPLYSTEQTREALIALTHPHEAQTLPCSRRGALLAVANHPRW